jgi:hypothetical protein
MKTIHHIAVALLIFCLATPSFALDEAADKGNFQLSLEKPKDSSQNELYEILKEEDIFTELIADLNSTIALPRDIPVNFASCGQANAFYDPNTHGITMCYELILHFLRILNHGGKTEEQVDQAVAEATIFIMFHEVGHALVHNLDIPVTGKEEDAVDDLAALVALGFDDAGENMVASAAEAFAAMANAEGYEQLAFHDEHSLSAQRMYSTMCVLYGSNPEKFKGMVADNILPQARAERCPAEYQQKAKSWEKLLGKFMKS